MALESFRVGDAPTGLKQRGAKDRLGRKSKTKPLVVQTRQTEVRCRGIPAGTSEQDNDAK